jgi:hypothetical protein
LVSAFEPRDGDEWDAKLVGDGGQGDVFGLPGRSEVAVVVDRTGPGEQSEDFAGDGSFQQPQDVFLGAVFGQLALDVVASLWVAGHAYQRDAIQRAVGGAVWLKRLPFVCEGLSDDGGGELPGFDGIQPAEATAQAVSPIRTTVLASVRLRFPKRTAHSYESPGMMRLAAAVDDYVVAHG